ncbi:Uncharacterized conserved protein YbjQ, UPF0145 family [Granulicella rosea]|uniref:Uncharacterized conserved protein YbjQ, UPF0145 family n=1 Tax=Granulicella rosea TaxID=474952 RepID=A0A239LA61_9BACT|nr:heavy metal-binding domain-containing protein [Granulicella rosea]SNT26862.1 Uncharacterized conserved protein YbjQ, UPF0145 family [Granulicella rosea]
MQLPINPALVVTTDALPGYRIVRSLGTAEGVAVSVFTGMFAGGQSAIVFDSMRQAFLDMLGRAGAQGANAIVGMRYTMPSGDEERIVIAYGTAVVVEPVPA